MGGSPGPLFPMAKCPCEGNSHLGYTALGSYTFSCGKWGKVAVSQFVHACDHHVRYRSSTQTQLLKPFRMETFAWLLQRQYCGWWSSRLLSVARGRKESTDTPSAASCAKVRRCSWLVITSLVLWSTQLLRLNRSDSWTMPGKFCSSLRSGRHNCLQEVPQLSETWTRYICCPI